jgi:hypothetical protein
MSEADAKAASQKERGAVWRGLLVVVMLFLLLVSLRHQLLEAEVRRARAQLSECDNAACVTEVSGKLEQAQTLCASLLQGVGLPLRVLGRTCEGG